MNAILKTAAGNPENQDRGAVIVAGAKLVLVIADGAGGRSGGTEAAAMAVDLVCQNVSALNDPDSCADLIRKIDQAIAKDKAGGETTCVVVVVTVDGLFGASVGDSGAWLIDDGGYVDLTRGQVRKPFAGSGSAFPTAFSHKQTNGLLLLATDGLLKYSSPERITAICRQASPDEVTRQLIDLVRYPSGALPDDVTVIFGEW